MNKVKKTVLSNRFALLGTVLAVCMSIIMIEGRLVGREPKTFSIHNRFFDLQLNMEELDAMMKRDSNR